MAITVQQFALGLVVAGLGGTLFLQRRPLGRWATRRWRRLGIEVPDELYAKQFGFIGILLVVLGLFTLTGWIGALF